MPNSFETLRKTVLAEVQKEQARARAGTTDRAELLGAYLAARLQNLGYSRADFAERMDVEQDLTDAILEGLLPLSELNDSLLEDIATAVGYEANVLRVLLGRSIVPTTDHQASAKSSEDEQSTRADAEPARRRANRVRQKRSNE